MKRDIDSESDIMRDTDSGRERKEIKIEREKVMKRKGEINKDGKMKEIDRESYIVEKNEEK